MKKLLAMMLCVLVCTPIFAKDKNVDEGTVPAYNVEGESSPTGGRAMIKVTIVDKKKENVSDAILEKCAVHAILFRGYMETKTQYGGAGKNHPAIAGSPMEETQHADFYKPFFSDGSYRNYVRVVPDTRRVVKAGKEYKVSATLEVSVDQLRKDLEKAGVIGGLNSGW